MSRHPGERRRTQEQRSAATVAKLVEATIDAIVEVGYAGATTREICDRAGVSQGGLFRHFPTRRDLIVAALMHLSDRRLAEFASQLAPDFGGESPKEIAEQLRIARSLIRDPVNMVFIETVMASRTEPDLRNGLVPLIEQADREMLTIACRNPIVARMSETSRRVWLDFSQQVLCIEALWATSLPEDDYDDLKIEALVRLMFVLADAATPDPPLSGCSESRSAIGVSTASNPGLSTTRSREGSARATR
jgi:AcrR family transcriptional regulator